jgi:hypothetical protein
MDLEGEATIGRAEDNEIRVNDASVSRYHAVIERRADGVWVADLDSKNGTTVNDEVVEGERRLEDGDLVTVGDAGTIEFFASARAPARPTPAAAAAPRPAQVAAPGDVTVPRQAAPSAGMPHAGAPQAGMPGAEPAAPAKSGLPKPVLVGAIVVGAVAVIACAFALVKVFGGGGEKDGSIVKIRSPRAGATVSGPVPIEVEVARSADVAEVIYLVDGNVVASASAPPYSGLLDPARLAEKYPELAGGTHELSVTVVDEDGKRLRQSHTVQVELPAARAAEGAVAAGAGAATAPAATASGGAASGSPGEAELRAWAGQLAGQISGKSGYTFDPELLAQVQLRTAEYRVDLTSEARERRREIIKAFGDEQGLKPLLGCILAASRSRFRESGGEQGVGPWRIPQAVLDQQGYSAAGGAAEAGRSAGIAAAYTKSLIGLFSPDDFMYAIACFGMPLSEVGQVKTKLESVAPDPAARRDFWRMVKAGVVPREGGERVIRFFAAGVVAENPRAFGLQAEPLSSFF